jgi:hypothetical protein
MENVRCRLLLRIIERKPARSATQGPRRKRRGQGAHRQALRNRNLDALELRRKLLRGSCHRCWTRRRIAHPVPAETMRERYREDYKKLSEEPGFLILRLLKSAIPNPSPAG